MNLFSVDSRVSDLVFADPTVLPVLNRFGIKLGVGEKRIADACAETGADSALLLAVVNACFNKDYFPEDLLRKTAFPELVDFMQKTDSWYLDVQMPNIERHFNILITSSANDSSNLKLLGDFFQELKLELIGRINTDKDLLFPAIRNAEQLSEDTINDLLSVDSVIEDKLSDLITFFVVHLKGEYNMNLCNAVLQAIFALERDIQSINRIRRRILFPSINQPC